MHHQPTPYTLHYTIRPVTSVTVAGTSPIASTAATWVRVQEVEAMQGGGIEEVDQTPLIVSTVL